MKKLLMLLIILIPVGVEAQIGPESPQAGEVASRAECLSYVAQNASETIRNAEAGFYLTCIEITCQNGTINHNDLRPILENVSCRNNNRNFRHFSDRGGAQGENLAEGATCGADFEETFVTEVFQFTCLYNANGEPYAADSGTENNTNPDHGGEANNNPETALNTYYAVLAISIIVLAIGLYYVNKQNLFKKI